MSQLPYLLQQAEQAMTEGDWGKAQQIYQQARDLDPNNSQADHGWRLVQRAVEKEGEIKERLMEADALFTQGDYRGSADEYISIIDFAVASPRILKFHPELEQKRNQAKELHLWQDRIQQTLREARRANDTGDWETAAQVVEDMVRQLPQDPAYHPLKSELENARDAALRQGNDKELLEKATKFLTAKDYEQGITLLDSIPKDSSLYVQAQQWLSKARAYLDNQKRDLAAIEAAIVETRWTDALAQLEQWRDRYQSVPLWQQLYLKAGMAYGRSLLEGGRQQNQQHAFEPARLQFERAQKAFEEVLKIYSTHLDAKSLCDESKDLVAIAALQAQAQLEWGAGRRDEAVQSLKLAQQRLALAKSEGRDYTAVDAVAETMRSTIQAEIERIREEERRLRNAESLWKKNDLSRARMLFEETLGALLPEHQEQATEGLRRVETKIQKFETLIKRGQSASDTFVAASEYQQAYDLWATGPGVAEALENALLKACESALNAGRETEAAAYSDRALQLNPDNHQAEGYKKRINIKPQVEATLKRVGEEWLALQRQDILQANALEPLIQGLESALSKVSEMPDLRTDLEALHKTLREARVTWQQYEQAQNHAMQSRDQGDWGEALATLEKAIQDLGDAAPSGAHRQLTRWQQTVQTLTDVQSITNDALAKAQGTYIDAITHDTLAAIADALDDAVLRHIEPARKQLDNAEEQTAATGGQLPADLKAIQKQLKDLEERAIAAADAARAVSASDGLLKIQEVIKLRGSDATLEAIRAQLEEKAREKINSIKLEAQTAIDSGEFTEAEEKLRQVRELDPTDTETAKLYSETRQRRALEDKLRTVEREAEAKLIGSPMDAMKTWRQGINELLEPEVSLPQQVREILNELTTMGDRDDGLALGQPDNWQIAQDKLAALGALRQESWAAGRAQFFVDQWIRLARDNALRGVVASAAQLGDLIGAYRAAETYLKAHPTEQEAIEQQIARAEALINRANEAANKRVQRAQSALKAGEFQAALNNLQDIEQDFYQQIDQEFPTLLEGQSSVQEMRGTIAELQEKALKLQSINDKARPMIDTARTAYLDNKWDTAEKALETLPALKELPDLEAEVNRLREQIADARVEDTRKKLHDAISQIETGRHLATTVEQLGDYLEQLDKLQKEINLQVLDVDERNRYFQVLNQVREQRESLAAVGLWEQQIEAYRQQQRYADALKALDKALEATREATKRVALETLRVEIEGLAEDQQALNNALKLGEDSFIAEQYNEARQHFEKAGRLGADVSDWIRAARAGAKFQRARQWWDESHNAENALMDLKELAHFAENNRYAERIAEDAGYLRNRIESAHKDILETQRTLAEAQQLLSNGQFDKAQANVQKLLERDPASKEAADLQTQIREQRIMQEMLKKASAAQLSGKYKEALQLVETVLEKQPDDPDARLLKRQVQAVIDADKAFLQVETLAKQMRFKESRELLTELSRQDADPEKLRQVQQLVDDLEKDQWTRIVHPIQELYRDGDYAEAWNRCKQASGRTAAPELLDELQSLQNQIVNRWAEKEAQKARTHLQKQLEQEQLRDLEAQLKPFLLLDPPPDGHWVRQFEDLLRETRTRRLRLRLTQARDRFAEWRVEGMQGMPQAALDIVKAVQEEAEALGVQVEFDITLDAASLAAEIQEAHRQAIKDRLKQEYEQKIGEARVLQAQLEDADTITQKSLGRADLERMFEWVNQIFGIEGYDNDSPARELASWTRNALDAFDRTQRALDEAQRLAQQRRFRDAELQLRGSGVSPLLKAIHERQREVMGALHRAEDHQNNETWDLALQEYRQALVLDASFEPFLEKEIERCYQRLRERVLVEIEQALNQTPPDTAAARALLSQAENDDWITPLVSRDYERMRNWLASQECVAQAAALLQAPDGDMIEARRALDEAKRTLPKDQANTAIRQWESLLEAMEAWRAYRERTSLLPRVLKIFSELQPPISNLPRVQTLLQTLEEETERRRVQKEREEAEAQSREADAAEKQQLLAQLAGEISRVLSTQPQDYSGAIQVLENASPRISGEPDFSEQCMRVRDELRIGIESEIKAWRYAEALKLAEILKRMPQLDQSTRDWVIDLPAARRSAFIEQLRVAEAALQHLDGQGVQAALANAEIIVSPEGDHEGLITDIRARLRGAKLNIAVAEVEKALEAYDSSMADSAMDEARKVATTADDEQRLGELTERIRTLRALLEQVHTDLRELNTEIGAKQWAAAVTRLLKMRGEAPGYIHVSNAIHRLQEQLKVQIEVQCKTGEFTVGLELCDLALRLEPRDDIRILQQQIHEEQEAALGTLRQKIQTGLDVWRLGALSGLFIQGFKIAPADVDLLALKERIQSVEALLPDLRRVMDQGWEALLNRDYPTAITFYNQALSLAPSFSEAQRWRDYTQAMREAARRVQDDAAFERAVRHLRDAESLLHVTTEQALPDVLSSEAHLKERRRHAVYNAWQLRQSALRMAAYYKATDYYFERQDTNTMNEFYDKIADESNRFQDMHLKPLAPPESFPANGKPDDPLPPEAILPKQPTISTQPSRSEQQQPAGDHGPTPKPQPAPEPTKDAQSESEPTKPRTSAPSAPTAVRPSLRDKPKEAIPPSEAPPQTTDVSASETPAPSARPSRPGIRDAQATPSPHQSSEPALLPNAPMDTPTSDGEEKDAEETTVGFGQGWGSGFWANSDNYGDEDSPA